MAAAGLRCNPEISEEFHIIDTIILGQEKDSFDLLYRKQAGIGHKLHFQPKNPAKAKLAAIHNKNGCGRAEVRCRELGRVSYH